MNGVGLRRWSSSLPTAFWLPYSLSLTSRHGSGEDPTPVWSYRLSVLAFCSLWTLTCVFLQSLEQHCVSLSLFTLVPLQRMCPQLWTKTGPFIWETVSFHCVVIGFFLSLGGPDSCTEIEVHWPHSASALGKRESLTAFEINLLTLLSVWQSELSYRVNPVARTKIKWHKAQV